MTKDNSSKTTTAYNRKPKPKKPRKDFPLTLHPSGQWCKKVLGKLHYFGRDPDEALNRWLDEKDALLAGRTPRPRAGPGAKLMRDLVNKFMEAKDAKLRSGERSVYTWRDHQSACDELVKAFGATRAIVDLVPEDFAKLRVRWTEKWSNVRVKKFVVMARGIFKFGYANGIIDQPMKYGSEFDVPSLKTLREDRAAKGIRMFEADDLRRMIDAASQPLKAMILLGVNGGMGNHDLATMPLEVVDLDRGWIRYARPKTGIMRQIPLFPETIAAMREWLEQRPEPRDDSFAGLFFLTAAGGTFASDDRPISRKTRALLDKLKIGGKRNFYGLRRTFETIAGECRDQVAVDHIMGHADSTMAAHYRERISERRLRDAVDFVHTWLFSDVAPDTIKMKPKDAASA